MKRPDSPFPHCHEMLSFHREVGPTRVVRAYAGYTRSEIFTGYVRSKTCTCYPRRPTQVFPGRINRQARPDLDGSTHHSIDRESVESDRKEEISSAQVSMLFSCAVM